MSSNTMKSMIKEKPQKGYSYTDLPIPEPVKDEVLIKVEKVAICGSDINLFVWNEMAKLIGKIPFTPGHEATGIVVKTGPDAGIEVGTRVAVENHFYCGDCYTCKVRAYIFSHFSHLKLLVKRTEEVTFVQT